MLDIDEMGQKEIHELLLQVRYGHLNCVHEGKPYGMPMHYYLEDSDIYLFTTVEMKTQNLNIWMRIQRSVCKWKRSTI